MSIRERREALLDRIGDAAGRAGRDPSEVRLIAVSKTVSPAAVREAFASGQLRFGENRAQELRDKRRALADLEIEWHFIGHLQTNKTRYVIPGCALIHTIDRLDLAEKIAARIPDGQTQPVLVQVNTSAEEAKSGIEPENLPVFLDQLTGLPALRVAGLMTIGPWNATEDENRRCFAGLREALERERRRGRPRAPLTELSMGMSGDFETAIAEGATLVRIGTSFFGQR
jgi:PLP dependent protein